MKLVTINKADFEIRQFPKSSEFIHNGDTYKIAFTEPEEIRMACYIRTLKVFKNNRLFKSSTCSDPSYFATHSQDNKYLALPTGDGVELTNLETGGSITVEINFLIGIEFDATSGFCIINGHSESKLVDLNSLRVVFRNKDPKNHISQCRFGFDNRLWSIEPWGQELRVESLDCQKLTSEYFGMDTPFSLYNISSDKYLPLIASDRHCIWMKPGGGMRWPGFLNTWEYVPSRSKIVYRTLIPTSEVRFSENYQVDSCEAEFGYIEILRD